MPKIAIHGFYGAGNLGDEAILEILLRELNRLKGAKVVVFAWNPEAVSQTYGVKSLSYAGKTGLMRRIWEIGRSNIFILGGGGLLKDYGKDSSSLRGWLGLLRLAQRLRIRTALLGVGVENIRYDESRKLIKEALDNVDLITVRDHISRDILADIGVTNEVKVTTDPAVLYGEVKPGKPAEWSLPPKVLISVRHWYDKGFYIDNAEANQNLLRSLGAAADFLIRKYGAEVTFVPFRTTSYDNDIEVMEQVASYMKHGDEACIQSVVPEADDFVKMAGESSLVIGMRLHSLILASAVGTPVIGLEYMPKVRGYMDSIGQSKYCLDLNTLTGDKLTACVQDILENYTSISSDIVTRVSQLQRVARESLKEIFELGGVGNGKSL
ncbi:MAG: polysaccharide pyruvyl transferase family protein [Dehalococcoidia bacterium]|jgi:polysaccharide pyruvyl transferase CsaB